jgi:hypothetical protein
MEVTEKYEMLLPQMKKMDTDKLRLRQFLSVSIRLYLWQILCVFRVSVLNPEFSGLEL